MRTMVKGFMFFIVFLYSVLIISVLSQRYIQYHEIDRVLSLSIYQAQRVLLDQRYEINSNEEYISELISRISQMSHYCKDIDIDIYGVDYEKGLLDVEVSSELVYPFSLKGKMSIRKTSIIDSGGDNFGIRDE